MYSHFFMYVLYVVAKRSSLTMADLNSTDISMPIVTETKITTSNNFKKQNYSNFGLRYKILELFQNSQPFLVSLLCILMAILAPLVISNHIQQNQLRGKIKTAYERTQSRLKTVENRATIPGPIGSPGQKGVQGMPGRPGLSGEKGIQYFRKFLAHFWALGYILIWYKKMFYPIGKVIIMDNNIDRQ